jgi:6-phosphogluconolactonase (cycloisomerase 2 family)
MSGIVDVYAWDPSKGTLTGVQRAHTVPHDFFGGNHSGEIEIHPNGKFLYDWTFGEDPSDIHLLYIGADRTLWAYDRGT